ncbi:hypothetical protein D3C85_1780040 [compost metagenome]
MSVTLALFVVIYFSVFTVGIGYMMRLVRKGPNAADARHTDDATARRPLSAAD